MSYRKRKLKRSIASQLKFKVGLALNWLRKNKVLLQQQRRKTMRLRETQKIMSALRFLNQGAAESGKRIDEWADEYVNECILNGRPVEILLQWCSGLGLAKRMEQQGGRFIPLAAETDLIRKQIPRVVRIFAEQGVAVSWIVTFNRSYIERRRLPDAPYLAYIAMVKELARGIEEVERNVLFLDWDEVANCIRPDEEILTGFDRFVSERALAYEVRTFLQMLEQYPDALASEAEVRREAEKRIAFESEEARFLAGPASPFRDGRFLLIPLERPERYVFFNLRVPGFTKRIVSVVGLYPWRVEG